MAANAQKQFLVDAQLMMLVERLRQMGMRTKYKFLGEMPAANGGAMFRFSHSVSFTSWGETITVTVTPYGPVQCVAVIRSECDLPTQVVDWGKNGKNVEEVRRFLLDGLGFREVNG